MSNQHSTSLKPNLLKLIGNDLVDLRLAAIESNWRRKGYITKICTPEEQKLVLEAAMPDEMLWLIWTMKEAACKIVQRSTGIRKYEPLNFCCTLNTQDIEISGMVNYFKDSFLIRSELQSTFIHSVAVSDIKDFDQLHLQYLKPGIAYKAEFNTITELYQLAGTPSGIPELTHQITGQKHAVSVSHHGDYLAVIYSDSLLLTD